MDKKLKKYIDRYDLIENCTSYELIPNGGMVVLINQVLINQDTRCEVLIEDRAYTLESFQAILMNAYEASVQISSNENLHLIAIRFRGAGASFFYEEQMDALMQSPKVPIFLEENNFKNELDS